MSLGHGASIVRDGLVLHLDAANVKSYPGTGTTWSDLSGNGNDTTLYNSPMYSTNQQGYFTLDGLNEYVSGNLSSDFSSNSITHLCFFRLLSIPGVWQQISGVNSGGMYINGAVSTSRLRFQQTVTGVGNILVDYNSMTLNSWIFAGYTWTTGDYLKSYVNGEFHNKTATTYTGTISPNSSILGKYGSNYTNTDIGISLVYNRALSESEVRQNFEALRGRYGI